MSNQTEQSEAVHYFRTMLLPSHVVVEVWSTDEDCGEKCLDPKCERIGFIYIAGQPYCVRHGSIIVDDMPKGARRHVSIDVGRPITCLATKAPDVLDSTKAFLRYVVDRSGSTVTVDMARRASGLLALLEKAGL